MRRRRRRKRRRRRRQGRRGRGRMRRSRENEKSHLFQKCRLTSGVCSGFRVSHMSQRVPVGLVETVALAALFNCQVCFVVIPPAYTLPDQTGTKGVKPMLPMALGPGGSERLH